MEIISKKIVYLLVLVMAIAFTACKKETAANVVDEPVVVGYLVPGSPISVKIYEQKALTDTANYGPLIGGLKLTISDGSKTVSLTESSQGTYTYSDLSFLAAGKTYTLKFTFNNIAVSATTLMPAKPASYTASRTTINIPLSANTPGVDDSIAVTYKWSNPDSLYHVIVFKNDDTSPYNLHPRMNALINFTINAKQADHYDVYFRTFNYLGVYRAILYSVNKDYVDALTTNANTSSQRLTNPPSNITNGYGIFTAMQRDTIKMLLTQY
jgi:hypothetical protein